MDADTEAEVDAPLFGNLKPAAYLNIIADITHNFTDGIAITAAFQCSDQLGYSTTLAVLFHEIPHEIGDYALLLQNGFTTRGAMWFQLVTAVGAFLGVAAGWMVDGATGGGFVLPMTAGGFIYIATVDAIPSLFEETDLKRTIMEVLAMTTGVGMMVIIALYE